MDLKKVTFDKKLECLVDENGVKYDGKRFTLVSAYSDLGGFPSRESAVHDALYNLETEALKAGAEAYEVTSLNEHDTRQEYDSAPYTASVSAMLYKRA
ncbi:MAG: hypothetical protein AABX05_05060 [Nanoarchaeota archaeon]